MTFQIAAAPLASLTQAQHDERRALATIRSTPARKNPSPSFGATGLLAGVTLYPTSATSAITPPINPSPPNRHQPPGG